MLSYYNVHTVNNTSSEMLAVDITASCGLRRL